MRPHVSNVLLIRRSGGETFDEKELNRGFFLRGLNFVLYFFLANTPTYSSIYLQIQKPDYKNICVLCIYWASCYRWWLWVP